MKNTMFLFTILSVVNIQGFYHTMGQKQKLKYDEVTLTNNAPIDFELSWVEINYLKGSIQTEIKKEIKPGETIKVKLGEVGGYFQNKPARIIYKPIKNNNSFKQEFTIDLPNSKAYVFTATQLGDIMKNILVPGVFIADDKGEFSSVQYKNLEQDKWQRTLNEIRTTK